MESVFSFLNAVITFVIALGILVFVHELGHFLMARLSGMRIYVFALGMGFRLFGWNKINGFTFGKLPEDLDLQGHCDYRLAAFPIGGYCQIAGMVDESFETSFKNTEPHEWEFRAKNPLKQAITIAGGVIFNTLLAIFLLSIIQFSVGETTYKTTIIGDVAKNSIGEYFGFKSEDSIISINDRAPANWSELVASLTIANMGENLNIKLNRNGIDTILYANGKDLINKISKEIPLGLEPVGLKLLVNEVMPDGLAIENDIKANDTIIAVNKEALYSHSDLVSKLQANKNQNITISIKNETGITDKEIKLNETGTIGVSISSIFVGDVDKINYNVFQSIWKGTTQTFEIFNTIILSIKQIIIGNINFKSAIGGPVMIAKQAVTFAEKGIFSFLYFTAMLSISLALINILPFPALDGGHLVIIIIEAIIRREIPINAKIWVQKIGMGCLLMLMAYVIFNDIVRLM